ncbi:MAG: hypothetical protein RIQ44_178, partial [Actinomycetota bacterium]
EASTILDLTGLVDHVVDGAVQTTGKIRIVRQGALTRDQIALIAGDLLGE